MISPIVGTGALVAGFLLGAMPPCLLAIGPRWGQALGWTAADGRWRMRRGFVIPTVVLLPFVGWLCDALGTGGPKELTIAGLLALAVGLSLMALVPESQTANTNLLGVAVGVACLSVGLIAWMPSLLSQPSRAVEGLNLGFIAVSLGWLLGPRLLDLAFRSLGMKGAFLAAATSALISLVFLARAASPTPVLSRETPLFHDLRFWLLLLAAGLYLPVESCLDHWSEPFLRDLGDRRYFRSRLFGFWCAYLLARLAMFWLVRTGFEPWVLLTCAAVSAMVLGNLVGAYGPSSGGFGFWLVGFCYGPLLPGFFGLFAQSFPDAFGSILGVLLALGALYHLALCPILHHYALSHTPRDAMRVPVVLTLLLAAPLLLVTLMR